MPKCYCNLISVLIGDWFKGPLSTQPGSLESSVSDFGRFEEEHLSLVSINIFFLASFCFITVMEERKGEVFSG